MARRPEKDYRPDIDGPKRPMSDGDMPMSIMPIGRPKPVRPGRPNGGRVSTMPVGPVRPFDPAGVKSPMSADAKQAALEMMRKKFGK